MSPERLNEIKQLVQKLSDKINGITAKETEPEFKYALRCRICKDRVAFVPYLKQVEIPVQCERCNA